MTKDQDLSSKPGPQSYLSGIKGVLFDLDGVLYVGDRVIPRARESIEACQRAGMSRRFITNTSTMSRDSLLRKLTALEFDVDAGELLSAPQAAASYLRALRAERSVHLLLASDVKADFADIAQTTLNEAECIVIGDIGDAWTCDLLDRIFNRLMAGARLIVIHKNRFWQTDAGLRMDVGGFVAALELFRYGGPCHG